MKYIIKRFKTIDSTNSYALQLAVAGARSGTVIVADYQKKGRGRYQRTWVSARNKDVLCSILLRPDIAVHKTPMITHFAAKAVKQTVEDIVHEKCYLKKPNDVLLRDKKISGILTESISISRVVTAVIVGVGINVNASEKQLVKGAISIRTVKGKIVNRERVFRLFLKHFKHYYQEFIERS